MKSPLEIARGTGTLIGKSERSGQFIRLKNPKHSSHLIGAPGMGKSTLMMNLILTDIERDDKGVIVLDPHADLVKDILLRCPPEHAERVIYFAPSEQQENVLGLNPFEMTEERTYEHKVSALMDVFAHA